MANVLIRGSLNTDTQRKEYVKTQGEDSVDLKIFTTQKLRVIFYLVGIFRTSSLGGSISSNPERTALKR